MAVYALAQKNGITPEQHRLGLSAFMAATGAAPLDRRTGIFPAPSAAAISNQGPMTARIGAFIGWADGTSGVRQGGYPFVNDDNADVTFDAGEPGNARIDRIVAQIRDDPYDSSGFQDARVTIVKGQAGGAANPVPPSSILLYDVTVPTGASAGGGGFDIANASVARFPYSCAAGGQLLVRDAADEATLTPHEGMRTYRLDAQDPRVYRAGAWAWDAPAVYVQKIVDQSRNNTTTLAADAAQPGGNALALPVKAAGIYELTCTVYYSTRSDVDIQLRWSLPSGFMEWRSVGLLPPATGDQGDVYFGRLTLGTIALHGGQDLTNTPTLGTHITGRVTIGGTGGTMALQWAPNASNATATIVRGDSYMSLRRVGGA